MKYASAHALHRTLATPICGACDEDIDFTKPCYFWPLHSFWCREEAEWALLCERCFGEVVAEDMAQGGNE